MSDRRPYIPRAYQPMGTEHIIDHKKCALWAGLGLGKGVMVLTALDNLSVTEDVFPALAVGPLRVARDVWPKETTKWSHLKNLHCIPIVGDSKERQAAMRRDSPIYSTNYENLPWLLEQWGEERWPYKTIIADESTKLKSYRGSYQKSKLDNTFLRHAGSICARALATVAHTPRVNRFIELTGTPAPNGLKDLWGQLWFLDAGERLGRVFDAFAKRWFNSQRNEQSVTYTPTKGADAEIHERVRDICMTIDAKDWFDLKGPIVNNIYVDLPPGARKIYREMEKHMFAEIEGHTVEAFGAAARTNKCLQMANGAVYVDPTVSEDSDPRAKVWKAVHDAKLEALDSIIEEAAGAAVMVVYAFRSDLARILKAYPGAVDLGTPAGERAFREGASIIGLCHPDSLGHGVDGLQDVCNIIVHFGQGWNLESYDQINARTGEIRQIQAGFDRPVFVHHILARNTVDEDVMERRDTKREVQDILLDAAKRRVV